MHSPEVAITRTQRLSVGRRSRGRRRAFVGGMLTGLAIPPALVAGATYTRRGRRIVRRGAVKLGKQFLRRSGKDFLRSLMRR